MEDTEELSENTSEYAEDNSVEDAEELWGNFWAGWGLTLEDAEELSENTSEVAKDNFV